VLSSSGQTISSFGLYRKSDLCTILFEKGPEYLAQILTELKVKMAQLGFDSISELKGSISHNAVKDRQAFERAQYFRYLTVQGR